MRPRATTAEYDQKYNTNGILLIINALISTGKEHITIMIIPITKNYTGT